MTPFPSSHPSRPPSPSRPRFPTLYLTLAPTCCCQAIQGNADVAHQFYRYGVVLKQVAQFYNTIDKQIVRSQKAMLLDHALKFEQLATNPRSQKTSDKGSNGKMITCGVPGPPNTRQRSMASLCCERAWRFEKIAPGIPEHTMGSG